MIKQFLLLSLLLPFTSIGYEGVIDKLNTPTIKILGGITATVLTVALAYKIVQYACAKNKSVDEIMDEFTNIGKKSKQ